MKISKRLLDAVARAKKGGLEYMLITKGGSMHGTAYVVEHLDTILAQKEGEDFDTGSRGYFPTKSNPLPTKAIKYQNLLLWFSDAESAAKYRMPA